MTREEWLALLERDSAWVVSSPEHVAVNGFSKAKSGSAYRAVADRRVLIEVVKRLVQRLRPFGTWDAECEDFSWDTIGVAEDVAPFEEQPHNGRAGHE